MGKFRLYFINNAKDYCVNRGMGSEGCYENKNCCI